MWHSCCLAPFAIDAQRPDQTALSVPVYTAVATKQAEWLIKRPCPMYRQSRALCAKKFSTTLWWHHWNHMTWWWACRSPSCMIVLLPLFTTHVVAPQTVKTKGEYFRSTCSCVTLMCFSKKSIAYTQNIWKIISLLHMSRPCLIFKRNLALH